MDIYILIGSKRGRCDEVIGVFLDGNMAEEEMKKRRIKGEFIGIEKHTIVEGKER